jgi:hypothetical protein
VSRTLVDLADNLTIQDLARAVHEAEVLRLFDGNAIREVISRSRGRRGAHRLLALLANPSATAAVP